MLSQESRQTFRYEWLPGTLVPHVVLIECARLYSAHYGIWGSTAPNPGEPVRLSASRVQEWLDAPNSRLALARNPRGELIGYAIIVEASVPRYGVISWVTQLVVHTEHRRANVAKVLLFATWKVSDRFAWGVITANPFAVRALEKATRRRCIPARIKQNYRKLHTVGSIHLPYISAATEFVVNARESRVNTEFHLDHSQVPAMLEDDSYAGRSWLLGPLEEGWEWFAFTFRDQAQIGLTRQELDEMLSGADDVARQAYSRMALDENHAWARHTESEVDFVVEQCAIQLGDSVLDFGCGNGRHAFALSDAGCRVVGVDYAIRANLERAIEVDSVNPRFVDADCRTVELLMTFDAAICLYDVVGSYADDEENEKIVSNLARHVRAGGLILISVMNLDATMAVASNTFDLNTEPDRLLELEPSNTMERSGNIFDPRYFLVDTSTGVVYRREQFSLGTALPEELIVRDRRYTVDSIRELCMRAGLEVMWHRHVSAGSWETNGDARSSKEILLLCRKPK